MQIACPWCTYPLVIEDDKVPPQKFLTKCPKCSGGIQVPGKDDPSGTALKHEASPPPNNPSGNGHAPETTPPPSQPAAPPPPAQSTTTHTGSGRRALVALEDAQLASAMAALLKQQGFAAEALNPWQEKVRLLHQGDYELVVTSPSGPVLEGGKTLHRRMDHLSPDARRRTFLILVGDNFRTGDGTQAFVAAADLVAHPSGLGDVGTFLAQRMDERTRVYRAFNDAERRRDRDR